MLRGGGFLASLRNARGEEKEIATKTTAGETIEEVTTPILASMPPEEEETKVLLLFDQV